MFKLQVFRGPAFGVGVVEVLRFRVWGAIAGVRTSPQPSLDGCKGCLFLRVVCEHGGLCGV